MGSASHASVAGSAQVLTIVPVGQDRSLWEFIRALRNDPRMRTWFVEQVDITPEEQVAYMTKYSGYYFVCCVNGTPAGYVGAVNDDIRIATHPDYQRHGIASFMLEYIARAFPRATAKIKIENDASLHLFEKAGFVARYYLLERQS